MLWKGADVIAYTDSSATEHRVAAAAVVSWQGSYTTHLVTGSKIVDTDEMIFLFKLL